MATKRLVTEPAATLDTKPPAPEAGIALPLRSVTLPFGVEALGGTSGLTVGEPVNGGHVVAIYATLVGVVIQVRCFDDRLEQHLVLGNCAGVLA